MRVDAHGWSPWTTRVARRKAPSVVRSGRERHLVQQARSLRASEPVIWWETPMCCGRRCERLRDSSVGSMPAGLGPNPFIHEER
jgi:hypothetical protein